MKTMGIEATTYLTQPLESLIKLEAQVQPTQHDVFEGTNRWR